MADNADSLFEKGQDVTDHLFEQGQDVTAHAPLASNVDQAQKQMVADSAKETIKANPMVMLNAAGYAGASALGNILRGKSPDLQKNYEEASDKGANFVQGALQGGTVGASDEAMGAISAPLTYAAKKLSGQDTTLGNEYRTNQQGYQQAYDTAKKENPYITGAGELAGGLATMPTLGISEAVGAKALPAFGKVGSRILGAAAEAGAMGGIQGGLGSEGTLDTEAGQGKLKHDILGGVKTGATFGGITGALGAGLEGIKNYITKGPTSKSDFIRGLQQKYQDAAATGQSVGNTIPGRAARTDIEKSAVEGLSDKFQKVEPEIYKDVSAQIAKASAEGTPVIATDALNGATDQFMDLASRNPSISLDPAYKPLAKQIANLRSNLLTPEEAIQLKKQLGGFLNDYSAGSPDLIKIGDNLKSGIEDAIDKVIPGYADANAKFAQFRSAGPEALIGKGYSESATDKQLGDLRDPIGKVKDSIHSLFSELTSGGEGGNIANQKLDEFTKRMKALEQEHPEIIKSMGYNSTDELVGDITKQADRFNANQNIMGNKFTPGVNSNPIKMVSGIAGTLRGKAFQAAQAAGNLSNKVQRSTTTSGVSNLFGHVPDDVANTLMRSENATAQQYGTVLKQAAQSGNQQQINSTLFVIQQNPKLRALIPGTDNSQEEPNE